jgi:hypothetical protein
MKTMGAGLVWVLLLVNLAAADCAWLMWIETSSPVHRGPPWEIYSSYASSEA